MLETPSCCLSFFPTQTLGLQPCLTETGTELHIQICIQILYLLELVTKVWKKRFASKISSLHSAVIFNSDENVILLIATQEHTFITSPNHWNLSSANLLNKVKPQTSGWGGTKCAPLPPGTAKLDARIHSTHSLPGSSLLIGDCLSLPASWPETHIRTNICLRLWHSKLLRRCYIKVREIVSKHRAKASESECLACKVNFLHI